MKKQILIIILLCSTSFVFAQNSIVFERTYHTITSDTVISARSGVQCHDGGYMLGGYAAYGMYASEMMLMKLDSLGNMEWKRFYGEMPVSLNCINDIAQLEDGSYICCGEGTFNTDVGTGLKPDNSFIMRVDSLGNMMWQREFDTGYSEMLLDMEVTDTSVFCVGYAHISGKLPHFPVWIVCDLEGSSFSEFNLQGVFDIPIYLTTVASLDDNTFVLGGMAWDQSMFIKTTPVGDTLKTILSGPGDPSLLTIYEIVSMSFGIITFGYYSDNHVELDEQIYYAFYDNDLNFHSDNLLSPDNDLDSFKPNQIVKINDTSFLLGGWITIPDRGMELFLKCYNTNNEKLWQRFIGTESHESVHEIIKTKDGGFLIIGDVYAEGNGIPIYLVKTDSLGLGNYSSPVPDYLTLENGVIIYPNPAINTCILQIDNYRSVNTVYLYDICGKQVQQYIIESSETILNIKELPVGMYIVTDKNRSFQQKLIKTNY